MRSRRVPVLKLGSRGPGGDASVSTKRSQSVRKAFAKRPQMFAKRPQSFAIVRGGSDMPESPQSPKSSRNAQLSSLFTFRITKVSTVTGIGGVGVAKARNVVTFGLGSRLRVSKVSTVTGIGGSGSRNPELSSLLDSSRVFASQKCQQSQGSGGRGRETQNCRHFWTRLVSSRLKSVNSHRDRGVVVAKPRTVVTFGLVSSLRVSKVSTVTGIGGVVVAKARTVVTFGLASGERKGERREEKSDERREERREERRKKESGWEKGERRQERGDRREERRGEERGERGEERG